MPQREHWEHIHKSKAGHEVSWYEPDPAISFELIESTTPPSGRIIDVGGGQSFLVDRLLNAGFRHVSVLDISEAALEATRQRLGTDADDVTWIQGDITEVENIGEFDTWHDRAVFHFLTDRSDQQAYLNILNASLPHGGYLIIGTFGIGGPERCSGLPICQYDADKMQAILGSGFALVQARDHVHVTPSGAQQHFFFGVFRRL